MYKDYRFQLYSNKKLLIQFLIHVIFFLAHFTVIEKCTRRVRAILQYLHFTVEPELGSLPLRLALQSKSQSLQKQ